MNLPNKKEIEWADNCIKALEAFKRGEPVQMRSTYKDNPYGYGIAWEDFDLCEVLRAGSMHHWRAKPPGPNGAKKRKPRSCFRLPVVIPCAIDDKALTEVFGEEWAGYMGNLEDIEKAILILRFGEKPKTLREVGDMTGGRTIERIRQIQNVAITKVRRSFNGDAIS